MARAAPAERVQATANATRRRPRARPASSAGCGSADHRPLQELDHDQGGDGPDHGGDDVAVVHAGRHQLPGSDRRRAGRGPRCRRRRRPG